MAVGARAIEHEPGTGIRRSRRMPGLDVALLTEPGFRDLQEFLMVGAVRFSGIKLNRAFISGRERIKK